MVGQEKGKGERERGQRLADLVSVSEATGFEVIMTGQIIASVEPEQRKNFTSGAR
jgi:hypothetical protein